MSKGAAGKGFNPPVVIRMPVSLICVCLSHRSSLQRSHNATGQRTHQRLKGDPTMSRQLFRWGLPHLSRPLLLVPHPTPVWEGPPPYYPPSPPPSCKTQVLESFGRWTSQTGRPTNKMLYNVVCSPVNVPHTLLDVLCVCFTASYLPSLLLLSVIGHPPGTPVVGLHALKADKTSVDFFICWKWAV